MEIIYIIPYIQEPMGYVDLKQCISDIVGLIPRDVCARPNSFEIVSVRRQKQGEIDSLVKRCYNTMATTRYVKRFSYNSVNFDSFCRMGIFLVLDGKRLKADSSQ